MLFHFFPQFFRLGFLGVDIFFVISGYLVTSIILGNLKDHTFSFLIFYQNRVKRLFPSLEIVLLFCIVTGAFFLMKEEFNLLSKHIFSGTTFTSNFLLYSESGYFDKSSELKPLLHLWSLAIEEQFYIVWPFFIWIFRKNSILLFLAILTVTLLSLKLNYSFIVTNPNFNFYMLPSRLWELSIGGLLVFYSEIARKFKFLSLNLTNNIFSIIVIIFFLKAFYIKPTKIDFNILKVTLFSILGTSLFIVSKEKSFLNKFLSLKIFTYIGLISYPLYLWHWPLISFANIFYARDPSVLIRMILLLLSFLLAVLTYEYIEKPFKKNKLNSKKISIKLLLVLGCISLISLSIKYLPPLHPELEHLWATKQPFNESLQIHYSNNCNEKFSKTEICLLSTNKSMPTIALIGDSHANHLYPLLRQIYDKRNENLLLLAKNGTPPLKDIVSIRDTYSSLNNEFEIILNTPSIHTVILSAFWGNYYEEQGIKFHNYYYKNLIADSKMLEKTSNQSQIFEKGLKETIKAIQLKGKKVVLFYDIPPLPFTLEKCLPRPFFINNFDCSFSIYEAKRSENYRFFFDFLKQSDNKVTFIDLRPYICKNNTCQIMQQNVIIYSDDHHLSVEGSNLLFKEGKFLDL